MGSQILGLKKKILNDKLQSVGFNRFQYLIEKMLPSHDRKIKKTALCLNFILVFISQNYTSANVFSKRYNKELTCHKSTTAKVFSKR
jgi:hypothetical protein